MLEHVQWADWAPDSNNLAVVRDYGGRNRLEYPVGTRYIKPRMDRASSRVTERESDRISRSPQPGDDNGSLAIVDLKGNKKYSRVNGLPCRVWRGLQMETRSGLREQERTDRTLYAITLDGKERMVLRLPGALMLLDISKDGRVLLIRASWRREVMGVSEADTKEHELSGWTTRIRRLVRGRQELLFDEEGGGGHSPTRNRRLDIRGLPAQNRWFSSRAARRSGAVALSPTANGYRSTSRITHQLKLLPTGAVKPKN